MQNQEIESYWRLISSTLDRLLACLDAWTEEELNWRPLPSANSLVVLAEHTLGNTEENILGILCSQAIYRNREAEFAARAGSATAIQLQWQRLRNRLSIGLAQLSPTELDRVYEGAGFRKDVKTGFVAMPEA